MSNPATVLSTATRLAEPIRTETPADLPEEDPLAVPVLVTAGAVVVMTDAVIPN